LTARPLRLTGDMWAASADVLQMLRFSLLASLLASAGVASAFLPTGSTSTRGKHLDGISYLLLESADGVADGERSPIPIMLMLSSTNPGRVCMRAQGVSRSEILQQGLGSYVCVGS
jgi:hypothetical protein